MLTQEGSKRRQEEFRTYLQNHSIDAAVVTDYRDVHYLTGLLVPRNYPVMLFLSPVNSFLVSMTNEGEALVDERLTYELQQNFTLNPNPQQILNETVEMKLEGTSDVRTLAVQRESLPLSLAKIIYNKLQPHGMGSIDAVLRHMQIRKHDDEIALMQKAIEANLAAYDAVQKAIVPGALEIEVLAEGQKAALLNAGEPIIHIGDYQAGVLGGPARKQKIERGQTYIVDVQTEFQGYWSDLCRTFVVGGEPTDLQQSVYDHIASILLDVPNFVKPGMDGKEVFRIVEERIKERPHLKEKGLIHHAGHSIGSRVHEMPDLNRNRGGPLQVGNVFACEPGVYSNELRGGVRLENMFLVANNGIRNLSEYPLNIIPKQ